MSDEADTPNEAIDQTIDIEHLRDVVHQCRADAKVDLEAFDTRETFGWKKKIGKRSFRHEIGVVAALQKRLFAAEHDSMLLVLQATDAGGKDGTIRSVLTGVNPAGLDVTPFKAPTPQELAHDFLWRVHPHTPAKGRIAVFNRSHYEDVLVVRVRNLVPEDVWRPRYELIRQFENLVATNHTRVVKIFLNLSKEEQRERMQDRVDSPDEQWKFRKADLDDRALWDDYRAAYQEAIRETTTDDAPWYVVPADRKWVRNLVVASILRHHLEAIDPQFPPPEEGIEDIVVT